MRKVAIAGVLAMEPKLLILDEPTAGLDPKSRMELLQTLHHIQQQKKQTIIMVTHAMDEAFQYAERFYIMAQGTCVLDITKEQLVSDPIDLKVYGLDAPEIVKLIQLINQNCNPPLPLQLSTIDDLVEALLHKMERGREI